MEVVYEGKVYRGEISEDKVFDFLKLPKSEKVKLLLPKEQGENEEFENQKIRTQFTKNGKKYDSGWITLAEDPERYKELMEQYNLFYEELEDTIKKFKYDFDKHFEEHQNILESSFRNVFWIPMKED